MPTIMKKAIYLLLTAAFLMIGCTVDVPDTDRVPPKLSLQINGDGLPAHLYRSG